MVRKLKAMGVLAGSFSKFTLKYFSFAAIMNGCYDYGIYNQQIEKITTSIVLSKLYAFWLYIFEIEYSKIFYVIINNIAYYLHLSFNIVYFLVLLFLFWLILLIIKYLLGWYTMYVTHKIEKEKKIVKDFAIQFGRTKSVPEYNEAMFKDSLKLIDELLLKLKERKNNNEDDQVKNLIKLTKSQKTQIDNLKDKLKDK